MHMAKKFYPRGNTIAKLLLEVLDKYTEIEVLKDTSPLKIKFGDHIYHIYLKCVSGGGCDRYTDNQTRAQLDSHKEFDDIKESKDRFLFLGYDQDNDVFVCWDPVVIKRRLNNKDNVAIWSRQSFQNNATNGEIRKYQIPRNPALVTFLRSDILSFLEMIEVHFPDLANTDSEVDKIEDVEDERKVLDSVESDISIKLFVDEKLAQGVSSTMIINKVMGEFYQAYPYMKYGDWSRTIRKYIEKCRNQDE